MGEGETEEWTECPATRKNTLEEKIQKAVFELLPNNKVNAKQWISFAGRIEQFRKTTHELESLKSADCFFDGYGRYSSNLVTVEIESFQAYHFLLPEEL